MATMNMPMNARPEDGPQVLIVGPDGMPVGGLPTSGVGGSGGGGAGESRELPMQQAAQAHRIMADSTHTGKILLRRLSPVTGAQLTPAHPIACEA